MDYNERFEWDLEEEWAAECEAYWAAIEAFDKVVAYPKVHGGEVLDPAANAKMYRVELANSRAISCSFCKYHRQENASGIPKHKSWKDRLHTSKRYGNRIDKRRIVYGS